MTDLPAGRKLDLPSVAGRMVARSFADLERAARMCLRDEQEKPSPDSALVGVLCDTVRLIREHMDYVAGRRG